MLKNGVQIPEEPRLFIVLAFGGTTISSTTTRSFFYKDQNEGEPSQFASNQ